MERNGRFAGFFAKERIWAPAATDVDGETPTAALRMSGPLTTTRRLCFEEEASSFIDLHDVTAFI